MTRKQRTLVYLTGAALWFLIIATVTGAGLQLAAATGWPAAVVVAGFITPVTVAVLIALAGLVPQLRQLPEKLRALAQAVAAADTAEHTAATAPGGVDEREGEA